MGGDADRHVPSGGRGRRLLHQAVPLVAALLLIGGGVAVAVGALDQDSAPRPPSTASAEARPIRHPAGGPTTSPALPGISTGNPAGAAAATPAAPGIQPARITIPAIGVDSDVITLGLAADGTLQVPQPGPDYDKAAWYDGSPAPGEIGPAVIEGHVDSAAGGPSVFFELGALRSGDEISVERRDGSTLRFHVDDVRSYPKDDFPILEVYGNTSGPELRLITCGGQFDRASRHYRNNVVVFATLAEAP